MLGFVTEAAIEAKLVGVDGKLADVLETWKGHLDRVDSIIRAAETRISDLETQVADLQSQIQHALTPPKPAEREPDRSLPPRVRAAIASRCGRGNVNRKALLESSARVLLDDPGADVNEVADMLLEGTGDFDL